MTTLKPAAAPSALRLTTMIIVKLPAGPQILSMRRLPPCSLMSLMRRDRNAPGTAPRPLADG